MGDSQENRLFVEGGNIVFGKELDNGNRRAVVLPSSGYSLGLRTAEVDSQGNFVPGTFRTQSDQARREERQDMAIARGKAPGASPEEVVAGQQAQSAKDKFAAYKQRRADRRSGALDIRREANAMRSYGPIGQQFMGLQGGAMGQVSPVFATKYGQTGPSLAQAAGMVRQQRSAQERMDEAMVRKQEMEDRSSRMDILRSLADQGNRQAQEAIAKEAGITLEPEKPSAQSVLNKAQAISSMSESPENARELYEGVSPQIQGMSDDELRVFIDESGLPVESMIGYIEDNILIPDYDPEAVLRRIEGQTGRGAESARQLAEFQLQARQNLERLRQLN